MSKNMSMETTTRSGINRDVYAEPKDKYETIEDLVYLNNQRGEQTR